MNGMMDSQIDEWTDGQGPGCGPEGQWAHLDRGTSQFLIQLGSQDGRCGDLILGGLGTLPGREVILSTEVCKEPRVSPSPWA